MPYTTVRRFPWRWAALSLLTVAFLVFSLPPYTTLDPAHARLPAPVGVPWYYPALVAHIAFGSIALVTACLQLWPRLRARRPAAHRWSGRVYVFAGAIPGGLVVLTITGFGIWGANQRTANTLLAVLWLVTTVAGYRAARRRRFAEHREWMVRSTALAFSIVATACGRSPASCCSLPTRCARTARSPRRRRWGRRSGSPPG
jgi:uncharacterized membrane protein YozB (DUF420 family)